MIIYKITNILNKKVYIGQTKNNLQIRIKQHIKADYLIGRALRKYGINNFSIKIIATTNTLEELNTKEIELIEKYKCISPFGYNLDSGGKQKTPSKETVMKIRKSRKLNNKIDLDCQISKRKDNDLIRLRVYSNKGRVSLGDFETEELALKYYKYCKNNCKFEKITYPRISKYKGNKFRLRININSKRKCLGIFNTKSQALNYFSKEIYDGNIFFRS